VRLTQDQRKVISRNARRLPLTVPTIEMASGSVDCVIAGIRLARC